MADYRLTPAAECDLDAIWLYTQQQWSAERADRYIEILASAFGVLAESPQSAPSCDHLRQGYRRRRVEKHIVYFRVTDYGISVVRVLHDRMDPLRNL